MTIAGPTVITVGASAASAPGDAVVLASGNGTVCNPGPAH